MRTNLCDWMQGARRWSATHGLFIASMVVVISVVAADQAWWMGCLAGLAAAGCLGPLLGWRRALVVGIIGVMASVGLGWRKARSEENQARVLRSPATTIGVRLLEDARGSSRTWRSEATITDGLGWGARVSWVGSGDLPVSGARITARGEFSAARVARNPGEFDEAGWMEKRGVVAEFRPIGEAHVVTPGFAAWSARVRHGFADAVVHGLDPDSIEAQVIQAMVIGIRPHDADEVISDFRKSGALHVFCVSGLHVAMVGGMAWLLLGVCGIKRRLAVVVLIPLMFAYAWLTGFEAPAARAAWMGAVFLGAFVFRRKPNLLNSLGAVLLVSLLWNGSLLFQPGVQLSYGVVAAIAIGVGPASRLFRWVSRKELYLPDSERSRARRLWDDFRAWLAGSLSVSLAAAVGSAPLTMIHFGITTPISMVANLLLLPLVFGILSLALVSAVLYPVAPGWTKPVNRLNALAAGFSTRIARPLADVPMGHIVTRRPDAAKLVVYDLPYGAMASVQTDAAGHAVMLDCGGRASFRWGVMSSLQEQGIAPRTMVLSHPDGGHIGGGYPVWRVLPLERVVLPVRRARSRSFAAWQQADSEHGMHVGVARVGMVVHGPDGAEWQCLHAPPPDAIQVPADDRIAVWKLDWKGWKILFMADAGYRTEKQLLDKGIDLTADVVVAGKHRQDVSLNEEFLSAVRPQVIVAKNPPYPPEEQHPPAIVDSWHMLGIRFINQESTGAVTMESGDHGELVLTGFLQPELPVILRKETPRQGRNE